MRRAIPIMETRSSINRREFAIGYAASISFFVTLLLLPAILFLNLLVLAALAYFAVGAILTAFLIGVPLAVLGQALAHRVPKVVVQLPAAFLTGALTAYVAFGVFALMMTGQFQPLFAFGSASALGVLMVVVVAGLCSVGGWATARHYVSPTQYQDALDGLDFSELAEFIRNARQNSD
jgi:hypothetical protein